MTESAFTDLPDPDSPTIPRVEPCSTAYESPLTARTTPSSVLNVVRKFLTSKSANGLYTGKRQDCGEEHKHDCNKRRYALKVLFQAEPPTVRRLHSAPDRPAKPFLLCCLDREQKN